MFLVKPNAVNNAPETLSLSVIAAPVESVITNSQPLLENDANTFEIAAKLIFAIIVPSVSVELTATECPSIIKLPLTPTSPNVPTDNPSAANNARVDPDPIVIAAPVESVITKLAVATTEF